jgi:hypothetical protein
MIGPAGSDGAESFDITVCTPEWLCSHMQRDPLPGRRYLFVTSFDYEKLETYLRDLCLYCQGDSWTDVATKLARIGKWEFEDYVPFRRA